MDPEHLLHDRLLFRPTTQQRELKSRSDFVPAALELLRELDKSNATAAFWADHKWNMEWQKNTSRPHTIHLLVFHHREWPYPVARELF